VTAICAAVRKYFTAIFGSHTRAEAMLVHPLSLRWLVRPFHCFYLLTLTRPFKMDGKGKFYILKPQNKISRIFGLFNPSL